MIDQTVRGRWFSGNWPAALCSGATSPARRLDPNVSRRSPEAAERLFLGRGVQAVGIDAAVAEAGVATKTLYAAFGPKDGSAETLLRPRDRRWLRWLGGAAAAVGPGPAGVLAVFDAHHRCFADPGFNRFAVIDGAGERAGSPKARAVARDHIVSVAFGAAAPYPLWGATSGFGP